MNKIIAYSILIITIMFNLWLYYPETQILADPNDNIFQFSLVGRTNWVWENYGCPLSLSCLPNLIDHNVPNWAEGYPLPFYYSHVPQIAIVSSYHLVIQPISRIFDSGAPGAFTIYNYYNWTKYLLLSLFPLSVFLALRLIGFSPVLAALGAFLGANFSTDGLYGIDPPSYLWRGYGLTSQLYAIVFLPLAIAFTYRALNTLILTTGDPSPSLRVNALAPSSRGDRTRKFLSNNSLLAVLFLTLTTAGHLGIGIIGLLSTVPFLFFDLKPQNIWRRSKKLFFVICSLLFVLSYWIIPILLNNSYHIISFWDPIWKFNSYGWYEVIRQFLNGEIFDWQRLPIITILAVTGFFALSIRKKYFPFALLFAFWFLLYFGRTTWGGLLDLIPGMKDFHQHRFIVGVHIAALFLIPAGLEWLFSFMSNIKDQISNIFKAGDARTRKLESYINITFYILIFISASLLIYFTTKQTIAYATLNNKWIYQANDAYRYDEKNFTNLLSKIDSLPSGRVYAGRPGNWGKDFRLGSTQLYLLFGGIGYNLSQFLPETWSPMSENEQNFDERDAADYDLLNIRNIVAPKNEGFASSLKLTDKYGPFQLYQAPATGWFDVVSAPMFVKTDKTNYVNLVHLWWNSYARRWKMHPLISVQKNPRIPAGMQKVIEMKDEVNYIDLNFNGGDASAGSPMRAAARQSEGEHAMGLASGRTPIYNNIFSDYPFVFPEATISAKIKEEKVNQQTYSATVEVPQKCDNCMAMFKMSYHPDWTVKVDGKDAEKFALFPFYLATPVTPGTHRVEFTYQPNRLKIILLTGEILAGLFFILKFILSVKRSVPS